MTKAKAIKILEHYQEYLEFTAKTWKEKSHEFNSPELKDTTRMLGEIYQKDFDIIQKAIDQLKPKNDSKRKKKSL